jgi:hypothetical protein
MEKKCNWCGKIYEGAIWNNYCSNKCEHEKNEVESNKKNNTDSNNQENGTKGCVVWIVILLLLSLIPLASIYIHHYVGIAIFIIYAYFYLKDI